MQKKNIRVEDLLCDDSFVAYHEGSDPINNKYWDDWIAQHPAYRPVVEEARMILDSMAMYVTDAEIEAGKQQLLQAIAPEPKVKKLHRSWWAVAAAAVVCILSFTLYIQLLQPTNKTLIASKDKPIDRDMRSASSTNGKHTKLTFPDGSTILLLGGSTLRYPADMTGDSVVVYLDGEAHFDIHHHPTRIFVVQTSYTQVSVLGTTFLIENRQATQQQVSLISGKIRLNSNAGDSEQILTSGQRALVDHHGAIEVHAFRKDQLNDAESHILVFEKATFDEISDRLKRYYNIDLSLAPHTPSNWHFTGRFEQMRIQDILEALCFSQQLHYKSTGTQSYIIY